MQRWTSSRPSCTPRARRTASTSLLTSLMRARSPPCSRASVLRHWRLSWQLRRKLPGWSWKLPERLHAQQLLRKLPSLQRLSRCASLLAGWHLSQQHIIMHLGLQISLSASLNSR